jgi:hypothetical protein
MPNFGGSLFESLGKSLAKQVMPEEVVEAGSKAAGETAAEVTPKLPDYVLKGAPTPAAPRVRMPAQQPLEPTTRVQQLDPVHAEDAARIEVSPTYLEQIDRLGGGRRVTHDETWAKALNSPPMTVEELSQWPVGTKVNEVDVARAGLLRTRLWDQYHQAIQSGNDDAAMEVEKLLPPVEAGYNNLTATPGRATEFQKVFSAADAVQARIRQLRAANIPYAQVKDEINDMVSQMRRANQNVDPETQSLLDKIETYATAAKLTSPVTHMVNTLSNTFTYLQRGLEKNTTAAILQSQGRAAEAEAARTYAWGTQQGFVNGARKFLDVYTGEGEPMTGSKVEFAKPRTGEAALPWHEASPGERVKRLGSPFRALEAADNFWKAIIYDSEINTHALAQAKKEAIQDPVDLAARTKWLMENPPEPWKESAWQTALEYTYQDDPGKLVKALARIQNLPGGKLLVPFIKTPANILRFQLRRSPLGVISQKNIADWKAGGVARAEVMGKIGVGTGLMASALALYMHGKVTGAFPSDPRERAQWEQENRKPWSILVNGHWLSFDRVQPIGLYMSDVAALGEALKNDDFKQSEQLSQKLAYQMLKGPFDVNFLQGMSAVMDLIEDPEKSAKKFGQLLVTGFVPNVLRDVRNQTDPTVRKPTTLTEAVENMLPGLSQEVVPRVTVLGRTVESEPDRLARAFKQTAPSLEDQTTNYMREIGWAPMPPPLTLSAGGVRKELDKDNRESYLKEMGEVTLAAVHAVMTDPRVEPLETPMKRRVLARVVDAARAPVVRKYQILLGLYGPDAQAQMQMKGQP